MEGGKGKWSIVNESCERREMSESPRWGGFLYDSKDPDDSFEVQEENTGEKFCCDRDREPAAVDR